MDITSHFKKGYTTTEFWLSVVGAIVAIASVFGVELDAQVLAGFAPAVAYVLGRSYLKAKRAGALAEIAAEDIAASAPPVKIDWDLALSEPSEG